MRERRRRLDVHARGNMADGTVIDIRGDELYYSYTVRRIEYTAAQDVSAVRDRLPADPWVLIGPATVKYSPRNPANSIVVCEEWSGLRDNRPMHRQSASLATLSPCKLRLPPAWQRSTCYSKPQSRSSSTTD